MNIGAVAGTIPTYGGEFYMEQLLYTVSECCRLTGLGRTKFYELVASGAIPLRKVGKKSLVAAADLRRWAAELPASNANRLPTSESEVLR